MKIIVYIASPYRIGDREQNVINSVYVFHRLLDMGYFPHPPLLNHFANEIKERPETEWIVYDLQMISFLIQAARYGDDDSRFVLLRLPGESHGADLEAQYVLSQRETVVCSIDELQKKFPIYMEVSDGGSGQAMDYISE